MADKASATHWSFWLIGAVALIWNIMGCINFVVQMNPGLVAHYRDSEQMIVAGRPLWATMGFGLGVFGGALGSVMLLARRGRAFHIFLLSLAGVVIATIHSLGLGIEFGLGEVVGIILMPVGFAAFLAWYSKFAEQRGWVRAGT